MWRCGDWTRLEGWRRRLQEQAEGPGAFRIRIQERPAANAAAPLTAAALPDCTAAAGLVTELYVQDFLKCGSKALL